MQPLDCQVEGLDQVRPGKAMQPALSHEELARAVIEGAEIIQARCAGVEPLLHAHGPGYDLLRRTLGRAAQQRLARAIEQERCPLEPRGGRALSLDELPQLRLEHRRRSLCLS